MTENASVLLTPGPLPVVARTLTSKPMGMGAPTKAWPNTRCVGVWLAPPGEPSGQLTATPWLGRSRAIVESSSKRTAWHVAGGGTLGEDSASLSELAAEVGEVIASIADGGPVLAVVDHTLTGRPLVEQVVRVIRGRTKVRGRIRLVGITRRPGPAREQLGSSPDGTGEWWECDPADILRRAHVVIDGERPMLSAVEDEDDDSKALLAEVRARQIVVAVDGTVDLPVPPPPKQRRRVPAGMDPAPDPVVESHEHLVMATLALCWGIDLIG